MEACIYVQGIYPFSCRERVETRLRWSERGETDPEQVRRTLIEMATVIEKEEANWVLDEGIDRKRRAGSLGRRHKNGGAAAE